MSILKVEHLKVQFQMYIGRLSQIQQQTIHDVSIELEKGEIHAVIGESGGGKSLLAHAILGILPINAETEGKIYYKGNLLESKNMVDFRRAHIGFIPQSISFLDPLKKTRYYMQEDKKKSEYAKKYGLFGLNEEDLQKYTFQLSGGMARRVLVYSGIMNDKEIIIADEPTPGLNNALAKEILNVLRDMANDGKSVLLITHDIDVVMDVADRISVFYGGRILETVSVERFKSGQLEHPYTRAIYESLPQNGFKNIEFDEIKKECERMGLPFERSVILC